MPLSGLYHTLSFGSSSSDVRTRSPSRSSSLWVCCAKSMLSIDARQTNIARSNLLVAVFRIISIAHVDFRGDMTVHLAAAMTWIYVQLSTAIILACCPLLRPVFEKMIPKRLTRIRRSTSRPISRAPTARIRRTTRILVHSDSSEPRSQPSDVFHDDAHEPIGPTFEVAQSEPVSSRRPSFC